MELVKPEPLLIGGRPHYTLRTYEPVNVTIDVPFITDEEVEAMITLTVTQLGGRPEDIHNDIWISQHVDGAKGADDLREAMRAELGALNAQACEQQKVAECAEELVRRLMQRVPNAEVARVRAGVVQTFDMSLAQDGMSRSDFLAQVGMTAQELEAQFDLQAKEAAEQEAAIDAWAEHRKLQVSDDELPQLLGIPAQNADALMSQLRLAGQLEEARAAALRTKTMQVVVAECRCTYHHETEAEAQRRLNAVAQQMRQAAGQSNGSDEHPHLKLV